MDLLEKNTQDLSRLADAVNDMRSSVTILNHDLKLVQESLKHYEPFIEKIKKLEFLIRGVVFVVPVFTAIISALLGYDIGLYTPTPHDKAHVFSSSHAVGAPAFTKESSAHGQKN